MLNILVNVCVKIKFDILKVHFCSTTILALEILDFPLPPHEDYPILNSLVEVTL